MSECKVQCWPIFMNCTTLMWNWCYFCFYQVVTLSKCINVQMPLTKCGNEMSKCPNTGMTYPWPNAHGSSLTILSMYTTMYTIAAMSQLTIYKNDNTALI